MSFSAEFRHPVEGSLYAASHRRSTQNRHFFFFFFACVCSKGFLSLAINLNF